jgi:HK97 family phage major capsid protein
MDAAETAQIERLASQAERLATAFENAKRTPSKASLIGTGAGQMFADDGEHFFSTLACANSAKLAGGIDRQLAAKAELDSMGSYWQEVDPTSKATVGDTDAAGGYLIPNNVVADINERATPRRLVVDLFTNIGGVSGAAVDVPWEDEAVTRATIVAPGVTKDNVNFAVNNYTATLYTMARIFDVGNQLLRRSQGAAEKLVRSKLARAFGLGDDWYALNGTGSTMPYGLLTALGTTGTYVSTFASPSDSTVAGSIAAAVATAAGDLEDRGTLADGVAMNTLDWWRMRRQGADTSGFWIDPAAATGRDLSLFGLPVRHSPSIPSDTLVVGEFSSTAFYRGMGYRVDTSSEAGDRWDKNLTGFRGESEIAFDARPAVYAGRFQRIVNAHA